MRQHPTRFWASLIVSSCLVIAFVARAQEPARGNEKKIVYSVCAYGATGDGKTIDTPSINKAIDAAAGAGGGTVYFPGGNYLSVSIHLKSNVALYLDQGATILAAKPDPAKGVAYDQPEPYESDQFQDFGHTHWHNSLIWGENLENISILGPGKIWGEGLVRSGSQSRTKE